MKFEEAKKKFMKQMNEEEVEKPSTFSVIVAKNGNDIIWKKIVPTGTTVSISTVASNLDYTNAQNKLKSIELATVKAEI